MIDVDKVKAAFAANPSFCQKKWHQPGGGDSPASLCAVSALISYAGVHPDLIAVMQENTNMGSTFFAFIQPVLEAYYKIPRHVGERIMGVFDEQENEWKGVSTVIEMFEAYNRHEAETPVLTVDFTYSVALVPLTPDATAAEKYFTVSPWWYSVDTPPAKQKFLGVQKPMQLLAAGGSC